METVDFPAKLLIGPFAEWRERERERGDIESEKARNFLVAEEAK